MDLSSVVPNSTPPRFVNSQLVSLPPAGILNKISVLFVFVSIGPEKPPRGSGQVMCMYVYVCISKQGKGNHVGVPNKSCES